jgi:RNA polymerase sigma factor (sigma-70 family)
VATLAVVPDAPETDDLDTEAVASDPVRQYLDRIGRIPLLNAAQEVDLAQRIEAGLYAEHMLAGNALQATGTDGAVAARRLPAAERAELSWLAADGRRAKDELLQANLRLVVSVAKKYARASMPLLDLVQEGNVGLVRAVEKFDYRKGFKFSTYATWWIRQAITRALAEQARTIRLPVHTVEKVNRVARARRELRASLDRDPTPAEVGEQAGLTGEQVQELDRVSRDLVSLDQLVGDDRETRLGDLIEDTRALAPEEAVVAAETARRLRSLLGRLGPREAEILEFRYGLHDGSPHTHAEIGKRFGLSRERIRQLEKEALATLRAEA